MYTYSEFGKAIGELYKNIIMEITNKQQCVLYMYMCMSGIVHIIHCVSMDPLASGLMWEVFCIIHMYYGQYNYYCARTYIQYGAPFMCSWYNLLVAYSWNPQWPPWLAASSHWWSLPATPLSTCGAPW